MDRTVHDRMSIRANWLRNLERELDRKEGIPAILKRREALSSWAQMRSAPSGRVETELSYALQIAVAEYDHPLVGTCLTRTLQVVSAGESDERWNSVWATSRNVEHGRFLSAAEFAEAWQRDSEVNGERLLAASEELLRGSCEDRPVWTEMAQSEYIHGVQLLLIAGHVIEALNKLRADKEFDRIQRYYSWHLRLTELMDRESANTPAIRFHFDEYFDELRDPAFRIPANDSSGNNLPGLTLARLRLALIRWIYIECQPIAGHWRHIIGQIGY